MVRCLVVGGSVLALLAGLAAAPHTHVHRPDPAARDDHGRAHPDVVRHAHVSPHDADGHSHGAPTGDANEPATGETLVVGSFVFHAPGSLPAPSLGLLSYERLTVGATSRWLGVVRYQPPAHGPPPHALLPPRAPPAPPVLPLV